MPLNKALGEAPHAFKPSTWRGGILADAGDFERRRLQTLQPCFTRLPMMIMMVIRIIIMNMVTMRGILYDDDGDDKHGAIIQTSLTFDGNWQYCWQSAGG